jgi:peroxiredoxin
MSMSRIACTIVTVTLALHTVGCPRRGGTSARPRSWNSGKPVEMELEGLNGGQVRLSELRGKPVVVFFFTTWCVVCQVQVARLQPVRAALGNDRIAVLGVALDVQRRLVPPFIQASGFNFPVAYGHPSMVRKSALGAVRSVPRIVILDARGRPVANFVKPVDSKVLLKALRPLLK